MEVVYVLLQKSILVKEEVEEGGPAHTDVQSFLHHLISGLDSLPNMDLSTAQPLLETMVRYIIYTQVNQS